MPLYDSTCYYMARYFLFLCKLGHANLTASSIPNMWHLTLGCRRKRKYRKVNIFCVHVWIRILFIFYFLYFLWLNKIYRELSQFLQWCLGWMFEWLEHILSLCLCLSVCLSLCSPWYNRTGWLGVKHQLLTYLSLIHISEPTRPP